MVTRTEETIYAGEATPSLGYMQAFRLSNVDLCYVIYKLQMEVPNKVVTKNTLQYWPSKSIIFSCSEVYLNCYSHNHLMYLESFA